MVNRKSERNFKILLFDADGTLLDYEAAEKSALKEALDVFGFKGDGDSASRIYKDINTRMWAAFERGEITQKELRTRRFENLLENLEMDAAAGDFSEHYLKGLAGSGHLIPGARELLRKLSERGFRLAVVTNGLPDVQYSRLEKAGINSFFEKIFISGEMGCQKPDRQFFELALTGLGSPDRRECLVIGDSLSSDIQGGINAEITTCWFNPQGIENSGDAEPDYTIRSLEELLPLTGRGVNH